MISITIPVLNEQENILPLHQEITQEMKALKADYEIIFINDGSADNTPRLLDSLAASDSKTRVIHLKRSYGQTAAMMAGFDFSRGDIIIPMDGDLQNNPQDISKLIERLEQGFDLVSGWRQNRKDKKFSRVLISRIANFMISHISGVKLHDYGCTLKAYRREIIQDVKLYGEMHRFIPIYAKWEGAKIDEISVSHRERINGKSKYGLNRVVKVILDLIVVQFLFHYSKKPIYLFGSFGLILILLAFAAIGYALFQKFVFGLSLILTPLPVLASMLFITGITSILMGLLAELITRTYHETQNKPTYAVAKKINF